MKKIFDFIDTIMVDPAQWHTNRQAIEGELARLIDHYAEQKPHSLEQLMASLKEEYPALEGNYELLEKGVSLREELVDAIFLYNEDGEPLLTVDKAKLLEAKLSLFDRLLALNTTLNQHMSQLAGDGVRVSRRAAAKITDPDRPGTAQKLLDKK